MTYPSNVQPLLKRDSAIDIFLQPGEYFVGGQGFRVRTLLGSCVSVILWHPGRRVGAMSHFLLPSRNVATDTLDGRYGDEAVELMCRDLRKQGVDPAACEARIAGGGEMFSTVAFRHGVHIGQNNGEMARRLLKERRIAVRAEDLFGQGYRQVVFDMTQGQVWIRHGGRCDDNSASRRSAQ